MNCPPKIILPKGTLNPNSGNSNAATRLSQLSQSQRNNCVSRVVLGPQGPMGPIGPVGPRGLTGPTGPAGFQGLASVLINDSHADGHSITNLSSIHVDNVQTSSLDTDSGEMTIASSATDITIGSSGTTTTINGDLKMVNKNITLGITSSPTLHQLGYRQIQSLPASLVFDSINSTQVLFSDTLPIGTWILSYGALLFCNSSCVLTSMKAFIEVGSTVLGLQQIAMPGTTIESIGPKNISLSTSTTYYNSSPQPIKLTVTITCSSGNPPSLFGDTSDVSQTCMTYTRIG